MRKMSCSSFDSYEKSIDWERADMSGSETNEQTPLITTPSTTYDPTALGDIARRSLIAPACPTEAFGNGASGVLLALDGDTALVEAIGCQKHGAVGLSITAEAEVLIEAEEVFEFHGGITRKRFWIIFTGILIASFVAAADSTIMASTHTSVTSAFHASNSASWLSTSFMLTATSFQPLYGRVSDTIGRRIPFVFSCFIFSLATAWCALAQSIGSFIAARAICGIGAGGMLTMGAIVMSDILPIEIRATYQSINNLAYGTGSAMGAALGGVLADTLGWRWEFGVQVPLGLFCMIVSAITVPDPKAFGKKREKDIWARFRTFDTAGSVCLTLSVACLILGMNLGGNIFPWTHPIVIVSLAASAILGRLLIRFEMSAEDPVMPLEIICNPPRRNLIFNNFFISAAVAMVLFNVPLYFQAVLLNSATVAGSRLLIPSLSATVASVAAGVIISRSGRIFPVLLCGNIILVVGTIMLICMDRSFPTWVYLFFLVPSNLGAGFVYPSTLMGVLFTSTQDDQAVVTSTLILWRCLGNVIGVASSSLIVQNLLYCFLKRRVTGPHKAEMIDKVRKSVTAIFDLPKETQEQAISSYASSLMFTFAWSAVASSIALALIVKIRLPTIAEGRDVKPPEEGLRKKDSYQIFNGDDDNDEHRNRPRQ